MVRISTYCRSVGDGQTSEVTSQMPTSGQCRWEFVLGHNFRIARHPPMTLGKINRLKRCCTYAKTATLVHLHASPKSHALQAHFFFNSASQFTTSVIGSGPEGSRSLLIKKRDPSGETS